MAGKHPSGMGGVGVLLLLVIALRELAAASAGVGYAAGDASRSGLQRRPMRNTVDSYAEDAAAAQIVNDIMSKQLSAGSSFVRSSPECWVTSIAAISSWASSAGNVRSDGSSYCLSMTSEHQEILALELTHCQLMKENRPLYDTNTAVSLATDATDTPVCAVGSGGMTAYDASSCFPLMSEYALSLYHKILLHSNDICNRLTDERMILQKEEVTRMLVSASSAVSHQLQSVLEAGAAIHENMQTQHAMIAKQSEELQRMHLAWKAGEEETAALFERQKSLMEEQTSMMREQQLESDRHHRARERAATLAMEQMTNRTALALQQHSEKVKSEQSKWIEAVMQDQRKMVAERDAKTESSLDRMERELQQMQEKLASANSQMQPLSSIESYVQMATSGFAVLKALVNFFVCMNITWMVTSVLPILRRSRRSIYAIFALGFASEVALVWIADFGEGDSVEILRCIARLSAVATLLLYSLVSCFFPPAKEAPPVTIDEVWRSQMEIVSKLNREAAQQSAPTTRAEDFQAPQIHDERPKSTAVKFREERGRSMARARPEDSFIISSRNFKPRRRRSRSPHRSSSTELPVVTPTKARAQPNVSGTTVALPLPSGEDCYLHRSDALAKQEEAAMALEHEYLRELQRRVAQKSSCRDGETRSSSSSDESSVAPSSGKRSRKRKVADMYASSSDESQFFSANDDEMSVSSTAQTTSLTKQQESKKCRLAEK